MSGFLIYHACDPVDCRQYVNVQLNSLPLALFVARALNRTLVLPPFMLFKEQGQSALYQDDGHDQDNAYFRTFGTYFNVSALQEAHANVIDWGEFVRVQEGNMLRIDHLLYHQHGHQLSDGPGACARNVRRLLRLNEAILDKDEAAALDTRGPWRGAPVGRLFGVHAAVASFQCGTLDLNSVDGHERWLVDYAPPRRELWHEAPLVAVLAASTRWRSRWPTPAGKRPTRSTAGRCT